MKIININQIKDEIEQLINITNDDHQPILLSSPQGNAVLIAEEDWNSIQETLYLVVGHSLMVDSIMILGGKYTH